MKDRKRRATLFVVLVVILALTMTSIGLASADVGDTEWLTDESPLPTPWPTLCPDKWCGEGIATRTPTAMPESPGNRGRGKALGRYKPKRK